MNEIHKLAQELEEAFTKQDFDRAYYISLQLKRAVIKVGNTAWEGILVRRNKNES
jgi:hypothetical protein